MNTDTSLYDEFSSPSINLGSSSKPFNFFIFIMLIVIMFVMIVPWNKIIKNKEGMSGGTLTQLFAQDSQDVYLKSNVDKIATGNFNLMWNDPTRITASFQNRGSPLESIYLPDTSMNPNPYALRVSNNYADNFGNKSAIPVKNIKEITRIDNEGIINSKSNINVGKNPNLNMNPYANQHVNQHVNQHPNSYPNSCPKSKLILPFNSVNSDNSNSSKPIGKDVLPSTLPIGDLSRNPYELAFVGEQIAKTSYDANNLPKMTEWTPSDYLFQDYYNQLLYNKDCIKDPASCGGGEGGSRLGEDFNQATKAKPFVTISGNTFYPDGYVGSYFIEPPFDISKPYPFMPNSNLPPDPIRMG